MQFPTRSSFLWPSLTRYATPSDSDRRVDRVRGHSLTSLSTVNLQVPGCVRDLEPLTNDARTDSLLSVQVNVPAESGEMGILAQHVPSIEQLRPGLIEVIEESGGSKQFFREKEHQESKGLQLTGSVSGGFAIVQPNSVLSINAVEGFPLEDFSMEAVNSQISEAQKIANGGGSEQDIAEAKIELEVSPITKRMLYIC